MTASQKRRFRMLCRELAALLKEVRKGGSVAFYYEQGGALHLSENGRPLEVERINP